MKLVIVFRTCLAFAGCACALTAQAETIRVAVASNFSAVAKHLAEQFEIDTGHTVALLSGSSGKHVAQIKYGMAIDVFLAADTARPYALEQAGLAVEGTRFTYAIGRLALWRPDGPAPTADTLASFDRGKLAIANPKLAPYGLAAVQTMQSLGYFTRLQNSLVRGENVTQAYQFAYSGNAQLAFVAVSQLLARADTNYWLVPTKLHEPIAQQAILLSDTVLSRQFWAYLQSTKAVELIRNHGYDTP